MAHVVAETSPSACRINVVAESISLAPRARENPKPYGQQCKINYFVLTYALCENELHYAPLPPPSVPGKLDRSYMSLLIREASAMAFRLCHPLRCSSFSPVHVRKSILARKFSVRNQILEPIESQKLVMEIKEKLERDHLSLPLGKNGRDDEDMILWFLKDRKFSVEDAVTKLTKAIKWRQEFGVSELSKESVESIAETGKAYVHDFLDVNDRPVLIVVASKHFPATQDPTENEKLCVFLIEKALSELPAGKEQILGIFDLRGFGPENADIKFLTFLFDIFYYYYPKRLGEVLFVDAPFVFQPIWQLVKPLLKSYASLVRFCSADTVRKEYFTEETLPMDFRN